MKFKSYVLILCLFLSTLLNATVYNYDTLDMFAKIIPRFIFLSSIKKQIKQEIKFCVLSDDKEAKEVSKFIEYIQKQYPKGINSVPLHVINTPYSDFLSQSQIECTNAQVLFLFNSSDENIKQTVDYSYKHTILTASYDAKLLQKGVDISLFIGRKIVPYINIEGIKRKHITLNYVILGLSKIFRNGSN